MKGVWVGGPRMHRTPFRFSKLYNMESTFEPIRSPHKLIHGKRTKVEDHAETAKHRKALKTQPRCVQLIRGRIGSAN